MHDSNPHLSSSAISWTLGEIAQLTHTQLKGEPTTRITGVADLQIAGPLDIAFFADPRYKDAAENTKAGALFVRPDSNLNRNGPSLFTDNPKAAFALLCDLLLTAQKTLIPKEGCIHPTAVIAPSAKIGLRVLIGPHVIIEDHVVIGTDCQIQAGCYLGAHVQLGEACHLFPRVTLLERSIVGNRVVLQSGAVIGSLGFGYQTAKNGTHTFIPHFGYVRIEDDVEIGANSTIDRGQLGCTVIGNGTKIDNQVQIGHNVEIGPRNLIVSQVGIAGSSKTGKNVVLAGKAGVNDHVELGDGVIISACSAVSKNIPLAGAYGGIPSEPFSLHKRNLVHSRKLHIYVQQLEDLAKRLLALETRLSP